MGERAVKEGKKGSVEGDAESEAAVHDVSVRYCPWGQVVYDHNRRPALGRINRFLDSAGVIRAGWYAQWGYMMTHDCVLRGKKIAEHLANRQQTLSDFEIDD